jgi:hypothetical protein
MTERRLSNGLAAADPGAPSITRRSSSGDYGDIKRALAICVVLALLGGLATTTGVAMVTFLLLANSHM